MTRHFAVLQGDAERGVRIPAFEEHKSCGILHNYRRVVALLRFKWALSPFLENR